MVESVVVGAEVSETVAVVGTFAADEGTGSAGDAVTAVSLGRTVDVVTDVVGATQSAAAAGVVVVGEIVVIGAGVVVVTGSAPHVVATVGSSGEG